MKTRPLFLLWAEEQAYLLWEFDRELGFKDGRAQSDSC